jgi:hypothetical protein
VSETSPAVSESLTSLAPPGTERSTLAFKVLLESMAGIKRPRVLDLGAAVGTNVSFFSTYCCRLHICDLYSSIVEARAAGTLDLDDFDRHLATQIPDPESEPFDLILAWDLFDYFNSSELALLGSQLAGRCKTGGHIFALVSAKKRIPALPTCYHIVSSEILRYNPTTRAERHCPQYKQPDLARALPNLDVETSFLLRHGVQEYVFCYEPGSSSESTEVIE